MAKVIFAWPPMDRSKGWPTYAQNRQFQYLKDPTFIYPMMAAICASMLARAKQEILWLDAVAEDLGEVEFGKIILQMQPDYIVFEASTPLASRYYEVIDALKDTLPNIKTILCGEHITALPEEVKEKCNANHLVSGGKWYSEVYGIISGERWEGELPHIDRNLTRWWLYGYKNGNYKYIPATYTMAAQDCWHRPGCAFCSWATYHPSCLIRPVDDVLQEIEELINMGFKEIFDDSGTFPVGEWLDEFLSKYIERGYGEYIAFSCNMRFGSLTGDQIGRMGKAGFRMILWGLESVNQETLDTLNKGYKIADIQKDLILAHAAGLKNHLTVMFGYPWETLEDAKRTYNMVRWLLLKDWAFSAQATICIPYPGTVLHEYCEKNGLLLSENWDEYDMRKPIMRINFPEEELFKLQKGIYDIVYHPKYVWNKLKAVKDLNDLKYYFRSGRKVFDRFGNSLEVGKAVAD